MMFIVNINVVVLVAQRTDGCRAALSRITVFRGEGCIFRQGGRVGGKEVKRKEGSKEEREEGKKGGREEGRKEGREEGREEGRDGGRKEGRET